jgi:CrcB protein
MFGYFLLVAAGGAAGATLRWCVGLVVPFPFGTLAVNIVGSLAIGILWVVVSARGPGMLQPLLITGLLGGFTTFSAFSLDTMRLLENGETGAALLYAAASVGLSVLACWAGLLLARAA